MVAFPLQRDLGRRAAENLKFSRPLLFFRDFDTNEMKWRRWKQRITNMSTCFLPLTGASLSQLRETTLNQLRRERHWRSFARPTGHQFIGSCAVAAMPCTRRKISP